MVLEGVENERLRTQGSRSLVLGLKPDIPTTQIVREGRRFRLDFIKKVPRMLSG